MAEETGLPIETRKEILFLHSNLQSFDHWQVLGVPWNASAEAVKSAYLEKVKVFHPDRYPGKKLGSFRGRIEQIFRRLTVARDALTDEPRRAEYAKRTAPPDVFAKMEARRIEDELRSEERRARLARQNPIVARAARVGEMLSRAKAAMAEERYSAAANDFQTVLTLDPRHAEARALAGEAKKKAVAEKARDAYERGLAAEAVGNPQAAAAAFLDASQGDPGSAKYAVAASRALLQAGQLDDARRLAEAAVRAGPRDGRAFEALGTVLQALGHNKDAKKTLEHALELDPRLEGAKALAKKLRWSFLG